MGPLVESSDAPSHAYTPLATSAADAAAGCTEPCGWGSAHAMLRAAADARAAALERELAQARAQAYNAFLVRGLASAERAIAEASPAEPETRFVPDAHADCCATYADTCTHTFDLVLRLRERFPRITVVALSYTDAGPSTPFMQLRNEASTPRATRLGDVAYFTGAPLSSSAWIYFVAAFMLFGMIRQNGFNAYGLTVLGAWLLAWPSVLIALHVKARAELKRACEAIAARRAQVETTC